MRSAERARRAAAVAIALTLVLVAAACGGSAKHGASKTKKNLSIVVLGDSVAAGEGIAYGYRYVAADHPPRWVGGVADPAWLPPETSCHRTAQAYGDIVAQKVAGHLTNLACTGASYEHGIVGRETFSDTPPEFGDWSTKQDLNPAYDRAAPDVVLVTLGANDLQFVQVVISCVRAALVRPAQCVEANPGPVVQRDVIDALPSLTAHYRDLVTAIRERAKAHHHEAPFVIFTTYYDPLPASGADTSILACPDAAGVSSVQVAYLRSLIVRLNTTIKDAVRGLPDVAVADVQHALDGHQWCSPDPWAYGPSVLLLNRQSQAPFHPTPAGQAAIAARVLLQLPD